MLHSPSLSFRSFLLVAVGSFFFASCNLPSQPQTENHPVVPQTTSATPKELPPTGAHPTATTTLAPSTMPPAMTTNGSSTAPIPTSTSTSSSLPGTPSPTPSEMSVKIFLIALEDHGRAGPGVGCGDSAVSVTVHAPYSTGVLRAALTSLLNLHDRYYGESGLYNALSSSRLTAGDIAILSGVATIHLSGTFSMGGECDAPRIEAQLKQTALQFSTVRDVSIFINNRPLEDLLSGRG
jgi:hypothetical protein